jgi:hypothetical protein
MQRRDAKQGRQCLPFQNDAAAQAFGTSLPASVFTATVIFCGSKVSASLAFAFVAPWPGKRQVTLIAIACYPVN